MEETGNLNLAVSISFGRLLVAFWSKEEGVRRVLSKGEEVTWQEREDIIPGLEESYEKAWQLLPANFQDEAKNNLFLTLSLPHLWFDAGQLQATEQALVKKIASHLSAASYQANSQVELLLKYLRQRDGEATSFVALAVSKEEIGVTPIIHGEVSPTQPVDRSDSIALDLEEGLARFEQVKTFSPRIVLWGEGDLDQIRSDLLAYDWTESPHGHFRHLPKVEILPFEIITETLVDHAVLPTTSQTDQPISSVEKKKEAKRVEKQTQSTPDVSGQSLGFVKGQDVRETVDQTNSSEKTEEAKSVAKEEETAVDKKQSPLHQSRSKSRLMLKWQQVTRKLRYFWLRLKRHRIGGIFGFIIGGLILLASLVVGIWWFFSQAQIIFSVQVDNLDESINLTVSSGSDQVDVAKKIIPGQKISVSLEKQEKFSASGIKEVGEKASGEVTIYNLTEVDKTFETGTALQGPDDLKFVTLEEVEVAAASTSFDEEMNKITKPGTVTVPVEATEIGPLSNLEAESEFQVSSFAEGDFLAKNKEKFSGGNSEEVTVVSEEDITQAQESLSQGLKSEAGEKLSQELAAGQELISDSISLVDEEVELSHKLDEEAEEFTGKLSIKGTALAYRQADFTKLVDDYLNRKVSENKRLGEEKEVDFELVEEGDDEATFRANLKVKLYPQLPEEEVKAKISGRPPQRVESYLQGLEGVVDYEIRVSPRLPEKLLRLPPQVDHISITVNARE